MTVLVDLTLSVICFADVCRPILWGNDTPVGVFTLDLRDTEQAGYGGDIIQFKETETEVFAIHRVWTLNKAQRRVHRLKTETTDDNNITNGCINILPEDYDELKGCCLGSTLVVQK